MEQRDYQALLEKYDHADPAHAEYPPGFDQEEAIIRFRAFLNDLEMALGMPLENDTGTAIQDASFHSEVFLPSEAAFRALQNIPGMGKVYFPGVALRFSNFGELAAVADEENIPSETLELVKALLTRHGYTYIPFQNLEGQYTGKNSGVKGTWWTRYFDWL